uniref:Uncharacterized protein n=1 Tax=Trichogramma kaykai TaxID=54128 RepID=A0ABD2XG91_9HYME
MKVGHWVDVQSSGGSSSSRRQPRRDSGLIIYILEETYLWSFPRRRDNVFWIQIYISNRKICTYQCIKPQRGSRADIYV